MRNLKEERKNLIFSDKIQVEIEMMNLKFKQFLTGIARYTSIHYFCFCSVKLAQFFLLTNSI